jgi:hypothetical protein
MEVVEVLMSARVGDEPRADQKPSLGSSTRTSLAPPPAPMATRRRRLMMGEAIGPELRQLHLACGSFWILFRTMPS